MKPTVYSIDIVLPWVDGNNPRWQQQYMQYKSLAQGGDSAAVRYRDWELLPYWFRAAEKFCPWLNRIFLITAGELPDWLNTDCPKLKCVKHSDYIPPQYLPTFSSHTIELNLHRINDLSEHFIYANDDFFFLRPQKPGNFFRNGKPCEYAVITAKPSSGGIIHIAINDLEVINRHFSKRHVIAKNFGKWFAPRYGKGLLNNLLLLPWKEFPGFIDHHVFSPFLKTTFNTIWDAEYPILDATCRHKFRTNEDVNQWLVRYWQICEGNFTPRNIVKRSKCLDITQSAISVIRRAIECRQYDMLCLNDNPDIENWEQLKAGLIKSFQSILTEKSAFEK